VVALEKADEARRRHGRVPAQLRRLEGPERADRADVMSLCTDTTSSIDGTTGI
jgi:hypothetical protein